MCVNIFDDINSKLNYNTCLIIYPPKPIKINKYKCDNKFDLDYLYDLYDDDSNDSNDIGIVLVSGKKSLFYIIETQNSYQNIKLIYNSDEFLLKGHKKGGQSQHRFERIVKNHYNNFINDLSKRIIKTYMTNNNTKYIINKLYICSPSNLKNEIYENKYIQLYFENILNVDNLITINEIYDNSIYEVLKNINYNNLTINNNIDINNIIIRNPDKFIFGEEEIISDINIINKIYCSKDILNKYKTILNNKDVIIIDNYVINGYGGIIGEKYY